MTWEACRKGKQQKSDDILLEEDGVLMERKPQLKTWAYLKNRFHSRLEPECKEFSEVAQLELLIDLERKQGSARDYKSYSTSK